MPLSLRAKLILTMSFTVAAATGVTSVLTQGYVRRLYEKKTREDFRSEVRYFSEAQLKRLSDIREKCESLAAEEEFIAAVRKKNVRDLSKEVQKALGEFADLRGGPGGAGGGAFPLGLGGLLGGQGGGPARGGPAGSGGGGQGGPGSGPGPQGNGARPGLLAKLDSAMQRNPNRPFVAIVDDEGKEIAMMDADGRPLDDPRKKAGFLDKQRIGLRSKLKSYASKVTREQEIAYGVEERSEGPKHLREFVVTPVLSGEEKKESGAIIVSTLIPEQWERDLRRFSEVTDGKPNDKSSAITSGFWLEGVLYSETVHANAREAIAKAIQERVEFDMERFKHQPDAGEHTETKFTDFTLDLPANGHTEPHKVLYRVLNPDSPFPPACQVAAYSMRSELEDELALRTTIISIGLVALAAALLLILFFSRGLTRPVQELVRATAQIREGNFDYRVKATTRDELGHLAESFNEMAEGLALNQKYQRLLSQVTDRMVAEQLINSGETALGGELREVTVLFCDIRGFTTLTSGMPPGEVITLLNEHMTALTTLVHKDSGVVDKFVGDMVMALFGAPHAYGNDAHRAAQCALRMIAARDELNRTGRWHFQVGIGIATGTVVAGCMGSEERLDYTVLGERVNLASRLCSSAEGGSILIDDTTRDKLGDTAVTEPVTELSLKGFENGITAYRLLDLNA